MRVVEGKEYRDMTADELAQMETEQAKAASIEKQRPLTEAEVSHMLLAAQVNTIPVDDATALRMRTYYPVWESGVGYGVGFRVQYDGRLFRALQAHTAQVGWEPVNAPSLWTEVCESHSGTLEDAIPYSGNMALEKGKYYVQDERFYLCVRDTVNPVYNPLTELVGLYVEEV